MDLALPGLIEGSGVFKKLIPEFSRTYGVKVILHILDSGKGVERIRRGKIQALIADDIAAENKLVRNKHTLFRKDVMYTELLIVGPRADPAGIGGMVSVIEGLKAIARSESLFVSRGDESGVARAERRFWKETGQLPTPSKNRWYRRSAADMRTTVGLAVARNAYTLVDKATWLGLGNRKQLAVMVTGDPRMELRFGISILNPSSHPSKKIRAAQAFATWLTGKLAQNRIGTFTIGSERPFVAHLGLIQ
jgi:tungstate transport system substrate-binding protein